MTKAIDAWLYDSITDANNRAVARVEEIFLTPVTPGFANTSNHEQELLQQIEDKLDRVIEEYCRRMVWIFEEKPDTHSIAIIALEADKVRSVIQGWLVRWRISRGGRGRRDEIISKIGDDIRGLRAILMQKLSQQNVQPSLALEPSKRRIRASSWTGERAPGEMATIIRTIAPSVLQGIDLLISAIENKRFNDEDARKTLDEARMLHDALGELLKRADSGTRMETLLESFEHFRICALNVLSNRWAFFAASPVLAMGTVSALHGMSAQPFDGGAIATIWGGWVAAKLVSERR